MILFQEENKKQSTTQFAPKFDEIADTFDAIVDTMVTSVQTIPRMEHRLFQAVEGLQIGDTKKFLSTVTLDEEIVVDARERIKKAVKANTHGPTK